MLKLVIFDFFATLFDAQTQLLYPEAIPLIEWVKGKGLKTALFTNSTGWGMFFTEREKNLFDDTLLADIKGPHELDVILKHLEVIQELNFCKNRAAFPHVFGPTPHRCDAILLCRTLT